jgi:hypothetical protein
MSNEHRGSLGTSLPHVRYSNYFEVGHNAFEFLLDFGQLYPGDEKATMQVRIVMNPLHAKELTKLLGESVRQYEEAHGTIVIDEQSMKNGTG